MKLKVLADNNTFIDMYYLGEPAVSYYIEDGNDRILFDVGYSDVFMKNAKKMNINLNKINKLVISHGHDDHTGGLKYFFKDKQNNQHSFVLKENRRFIWADNVLNIRDLGGIPTKSNGHIDHRFQFLYRI